MLVIIMMRGKFTQQDYNTRNTIVGGPKNPTRNRAPIRLTSPVEDFNKRIKKLTRIRHCNYDTKKKIETKSLIEATKLPRKPETSRFISPLAEDLQTKIKKVSKITSLQLQYFYSLG
jgi:hypothetical protein